MENTPSHEELQQDVTKAKLSIAKAQTAKDVTTEICAIWIQVRPYIDPLTKMPKIGKYIALFEDLMDTLCKVG